MTRHNSRVTRLLVILLVGLTTASALAQQPGRGRRGAGRGDSPRQRGNQAAPAADAATRPLAIVNAEIYTVTNGRIRGGTILIRDGKIQEVGQNVEVPRGTRVIDAQGKYVTPGFVAISMAGIGAATSTSSRDKLEDGLDPYDRNIQMCLASGITSGCLQIGGGRGRGRFGAEVGPDQRFLGIDPEVAPPEVDNPDFGKPESVCECCGLPILPTEPIPPRAPNTGPTPKYAGLKMSYRHLEPMLMAESVFYSATAASMTGPINRENWERQIQSAREYVKAQAEHEQAVAAGKTSKPPRKSVSDDLIKLVKKEIALRVDVDSAADIRDMVQLAQELDYRVVIDGGIEAWLVAEDLSRAGASVIVTPRQRRAPNLGKEDESGSSIETSGILERAGTPFAVAALSTSIRMTFGIAGRDLSALPLDAAFAVRGGCSEQAALEAITIVPARMMGLEDRIGSIEAGKDADLLILNGPPLDYRTAVMQAIVAGRVCYDRQEDDLVPIHER